MQLTFKELSANIGSRQVLQQLSFNVEGGEVLAIVGPNGAGKSSILNIIAGDLQPSEGQFCIDQQPAAGWAPQAMARRMAFLPQTSLLNFSYTVEEVILLGRIPHSSGASRDQEIATEVMQELDLLAVRHALYTQLSGGEKQRVQIARTLCQIWPSENASENCVLLDEPSSALDLKHRVQVLELLRRLASQGCTVLLVLHDFNLAARYADRLLLLSKGRNIAFGSAEEVLTEKALRDVFGVNSHVIPHPETGQPVVIV